MAVAPWLTDYSGAAGAGAAFQGFAQALQTAQDRALQRQEMQAKINAQQTQMQREQDETTLQAQSQGLKRSATGGFEPADLSPVQQQKEARENFEAGGIADPTVPGGFRQNPQAPKVIAAKRAGTVFQTNQDNKENTRWSDFAKTVADPSSRALVGRYQAQLDKVGTVTAYERTLGMPPGQTAPENETQAERIARYDRANPQDVYEMGTAADQMLKQGQGTVYGTDHMIPKDIGLAVSALTQYGANKPVPANSGQFIDKSLNLFKREGSYYQQARDSAVKKVAAGFIDLKKKDPDRWDAVLGNTSNGAQPVQADQPKGVLGATGAMPMGHPGMNAPQGQQQAAPAYSPHPLDTAAVTAAKAVVANKKAPADQRAKAQQVLDINGVK